MQLSHQPAQTANMQKTECAAEPPELDEHFSHADDQCTRQAKIAQEREKSCIASRQAGRQVDRQKDRVGGTGRQRREARDMETY